MAKWPSRAFVSLPSLNDRLMSPILNLASYFCRSHNEKRIYYA